MSLSELRTLLVKTGNEWDLRWTREQIVGLLRGRSATERYSMDTPLQAVPERQQSDNSKPLKRKYRVELMGEFEHLTFLNAFIDKTLVCSRERLWSEVYLDGSEMLRVELGPPRGFLTLPLSVIIGKTFPLRRMTYWEHTTGHVAGTITLGIVCREVKDAHVKPGEAALTLAEQTAKTKELSESTDETPNSTARFNELLIEIESMEKMNQQLRTQIALLMKE